MTSADALRGEIQLNHLRPEEEVLTALISGSGPSDTLRKNAAQRGTALVQQIRQGSAPGLMEVFLAEYGLSTDEGIALMCLAEALLRVPDNETIDALIEDKIAPSAWGEHLGQSSSPLVNASTWALLLTGKVLQDGEGMASVLQSALKRVGEPIIRAAVGRAMKELGAQFVLGETIAKAVKRGRAMEQKGYTYSYDMLGEAALTAKDARDFFNAYAGAITTLAPHCRSKDIRENPGISIKLSALHPRYEVSQQDRVLSELADRTLTLAKLAKEAGMGLNIDAEEADRLSLSLDVIEKVLSDPGLAGWDGFGVVVQAYGKRAAHVIDWLHALADKLDRKIMVRLVKGAYWDAEIKRAQVEGLSGFPVFTRKAATDVSFICCAGKLLGMTDRIYPQFATHNAHSVATILEMAGEARDFEFQRLHGMGEALHEVVRAESGTRCRIYAPVGAHEDLLAYLVRRLLENGANSSFVNQIVDESIPPEVVSTDPFEGLNKSVRTVKMPADLFLPERQNSAGFDLHAYTDLRRIEAARKDFRAVRWQAGPLLASGDPNETEVLEVRNPADGSDLVGHLRFATDADASAAVHAAKPWSEEARARAQVLNTAADLYEQHFGEFFALLAREAGKTPADQIAELREAVDFLRYYAVRGEELAAGPRGTFVCISPWNFPLAIFTGQIAAALAAGNAVIAKPAEATSLIACRAVELLHQAGVPRAALQLLPGLGTEVGAHLTSTGHVDGVCFTGSTATAQAINRGMAAHMAPGTPLIAETGGLNAMIVDSTALPQQAVTDIVMSAFQSAGQRCSALRVLYLQEDIAESFLDMLYGAMDELVLGNPWEMRTDIGPVINEAAREKITAHIEAARVQGRVLKDIPIPERGLFVAPTVIRVEGISELKEEIFGPVLHVATYRSDQIDAVVSAVNATGYGLTFGIHSRIDDRVEDISSKVRAGNIYINRNQIGAIVGSQPFGGEGMSGTGPKAGGPAYVRRFARSVAGTGAETPGALVAQAKVQAALSALSVNTTPTHAQVLPGPTGESNRLSTYGRGRVLCLGPGKEAALAQADTARSVGAAPLAIAPGLVADEGLDGLVDPDMLAELRDLEAVVSCADAETLRRMAVALASRKGPIVPLLTETDLEDRLSLERHICIDTTAAGGNATLLAEASSAEV